LNDTILLQLVSHSLACDITVLIDGSQLQKNGMKYVF